MREHDQNRLGVCVGLTYRQCRLGIDSCARCTGWLGNLVWVIRVPAVGEAVTTSNKCQSLRRHTLHLYLPVEIPMRQVLGIDTLLLGPFTRISQRAKLAETVQHKDHVHGRDLDPSRLPKVSRKQVKDGARAQDSKVQGGKVVVEEELTLHEEEGEVVHCPADDEEAADFIVYADRR